MIIVIGCEACLINEYHRTICEYNGAGDVVNVCMRFADWYLPATPQHHDHVVCASHLYTLKPEDQAKVVTIK